MDEITKKYIRDAIQDLLDETFDEIELPVYIMSANLTEKEKKWADNHIGVHITVDIIE